MTFRHQDWYAEEIVDRRFVNCVFHDVDLTEAVSRGPRSSGAPSAGSPFNSSRHTDSAFIRCMFRRCNFFEAEFTGCKLVGSTFDRV